MRVDLLFSPPEVTPSQISGRVVAVIDVLRASTSIAVAVANGARLVVPVAETEEVIRRAKAFERSEVLLAGERKMHPIDGFDVGNSPTEFHAAAVEGKTVLLTTTNGTAALLAVQGARDVVVASYVNLGATLALLRTALRGGTDVTLLCAGSERQFALEDAACAGRYAAALVGRGGGVDINDAARASVLIARRYGDHVDRVFAESENGQALAEAGYGRDLVACAAIDSYPVIPVFRDRQITKIGPDRER